MPKILKSVLDAHVEDPGMVLHIGAGKGSDLEHYLEASFEKIILTEPLPEFATGLRRKATNMDSVEVFEQAISASNSDSLQLNVCNNPRYSSILPLAHSAAHLPNLEIEASIAVTNSTLNGLINKVKPPQKAVNLLVLEVQGAEIELLSSVSTKLLHQFELILVRTSEVLIYEDGSSPEAIKGALQEMDYQLSMVYSERFSHTEQWYRYSQQVRSLHRKLKKYKRKHDHLESLREAQKTEENRLKKLFEQSTAETLRLQSELASSIAQSQDLQQLYSDQGNQIEELQHRETDLQKQLTLSQSDISRLEELRAKLNLELESLSQENAAQAKRNGTLTDSITELESQILAITQEKETLSDQVSQLELERSEALRLIEAEAKLELEALSQENVVLAERNGTLTDSITELESQILAITQEKETLSDQVSQLELQNSELASEKTELENKSQLLEKENQELVYRQTLLDQQIAKAEAQLELISNVIIREKAF